MTTSSGDDIASESQHRAERGSLQPSEIFANRYVINKLLGQGGMGKVYLAEDQIMQEKVALKVLHLDLCKDENHQKRFLREVKLSRQITHENIVKTYDVNRWEGYLYFVMEYVEAPSLKEKLAYQEYLSPGEATDILIQICSALHAIHKENVTHRDLKPANILLTRNNIVKLTDFGVARPALSDITHSDEVVGSPSYIAPEIWKGEEQGPPSDIYSLGVLAYELLTGMPPFDGLSPAEIMCKHLESRPVPPLDVIDGIPLWLNSLVLKMLEKKPADRPSSARLLEEALLDACRHFEEEGNQLEVEDDSELSAISLSYAEEDPPPSSFDVLPHQENAEEESYIRPYDLPDKEQVDKQAKVEMDSGSLEQRRASLVSKLMFLGFSIALAAILFGSWSLSSSLLEKAAAGLDRQMLTASLLTAWLHYSLALAVPFYLLIYVASALSFGTARRSFSIAAKSIAAILLIPFLTYYIRVEHLASYVNPEAVERKEILVMAEASAINVAEAAFLLPVGRFFEAHPIFLSAEKEMVGLFEVPPSRALDHGLYTLILLAYAGLLLELARRAITCGIDSIRPSNVYKALVLAISPGALLYTAVKAAPSFFPYFLLEKITLPLGPFSHEFEIAAVAAAASSWTLVFGVVAFFAIKRKEALSLRRSIKENTATFKRSFL